MKGEELIVCGPLAPAVAEIVRIITYSPSGR
jgi:hypothetical protein